MNPITLESTMNTPAQLVADHKNDPEYKRLNKRIAKILKKAKRKKLMVDAFNGK